MEEGSDSGTDSNSDWVNVHRSPYASTATEESSVNRSSLSSTESEDEKINEPASDNNTDQQSFVGRLWSSVHSWSSMASRWGGSAADQAAGDSDFECFDLAGDSEEKMVSGRKKGKSATTLLKFVKGKWKSEDAVEDNEKRLMHEDDDASVLETVLKENSELQKKYSHLWKKLSDNDKTIKSYTSQLQKNKEEIKRLKKLTDKPRTAPVKVQAQYKVQPSYQRLADEKAALENEVGRLNLESSKLRESLDQVTRDISGYEARIKDIRKQAEQVEVKYQVEREEKERLNSQVKHLQEQFKSLLARDEKGELQCSDDKIQSNAVIGRLQGRIKQLNEDLTSLREHSKTQSRQIIVLRQKAELTEHLEEQVASIDSLLIETEGERDDLRRKLIHLAATDDESNFKTVQLDPQDADVVELKREAQIEQAQASQVDDLRALNSDLEIQVREKQALQDQVEALELQVVSYKSDFEEEREDRAAAHGKMADMEKEIAHLKGRSSHEKAELKLEVDQLERDKDTYKEVLQDKEHKLRVATIELEKHKKVLHDLETVHSRHVQEAGKQIRELASQASQAKSKLQAKVSQVKQYSKENEKLKLQVSTAMEILKVMAEEMDKDRKRAFELQGKLDKFRKGATTKGKRVYLPDPCEAAEKKVTKLEELYDTALTEVQTKHDQMQLIPSASLQQRGATSEQPLRPGSTDDIISDEVGIAGAGNLLQLRDIPPSKQLPLRARAPDGLPDPCEAAKKRVDKLEELYDTAVTEVQADAVDLKKRNTQLMSNTIQLEQELVSKFKDVQALKSEAVQLQERVERLKRSVNQLEIKTDCLERQLSDSDEKIKVLKDTATNMLMRCRSLLGQTEAECPLPETECDLSSKLNQIMEKVEGQKCQNEKVKIQLKKAIWHLEEQLQWVNDEVIKFTSLMSKENDLLPFVPAGMNAPPNATKNIGRGAFGSVDLVEINGIHCAAKTIYGALVGGPEQEYVSSSQRKPIQDKFQQECLLICKTRHQNIVQFMGVYYHDKKNGNIVLFMEYLPIDLHNCLQRFQCNDINIQTPMKLSILIDVCSGLLHIHNFSILHRDLTARNVLLTHHLNAKISDFGSSKRCNQSQKLTQAPGALPYMPPEAKSETPSYNTALDVFSFGVLTLFIAIQTFPELPMQFIDIPRDVRKRGEEELYVRRKWIARMSEGSPLHHIVLDCLQDSPSKRPFVKVLKTHLQELYKKLSNETKDKAFEQMLLYISGVLY